jgi:hypothetical protein
MAIIYTYPSLSSIESQDSFLVTDVSDSNKTKKITLANVLSSEGLVQNKKITLTSAQILDLHNTPVELVPTPGANKFIHVLNIYTYLDFNSIAYVTSINSDIRARYGDGTTTVQYGPVFSSSSLAKTEDFYQATPSWPGQASDSSWLPNENIELYCAQANSSGDSPINVYISYIIKDL